MMSNYFEETVEKITNEMQNDIIDKVREIDFLKSINVHQPINYTTYLKVVYSNTSLKKDEKAVESLLQGTFPNIKNGAYNYRGYFSFTWKDFYIEIPPGTDFIFVHTDSCYCEESNIEKLKVLIEEVLPNLEKFCDFEGAKISQFCNNKFCYHNFENLQRMYENAKEKEDMER